MLLRVLTVVIVITALYLLFRPTKSRPNKGKSTMFDVRRLIIQGEKEAAIKLYGEIFRTNYKESKKAVDDLDKSIQQKKSGLG